ncbi:MAG: TIGR02452 family protein [Lachnospiraceae bacterium]|nr:TIGR02452 family protein [Lachnospiraceae bacterium]
MGWNDAYWKNRDGRKANAAAHHERMLQTKSKDITDSVNGTKIYSDKVDGTEESIGSPESTVVNMDTVSAIFEYSTGDERTIVLNFASFKNPGGGFLGGSSAQEESLCMESTLYEVLSDPKLAEYYAYNNAHKNRALYQNRALLSPGIVFERDGKEVKASVLTCASPNRKAYMDHMDGATEEENLRVLEDRIQFVADIINAQKAEVAILGAFGCGVFGQDPKTVARLFKEKMERSSVKKIVYAVIDKGGHSKEGAYALFRQVIGD